TPPYPMPVCAAPNPVYNIPVTPAPNPVYNIPVTPPPAPPVVACTYSTTQPSASPVIVRIEKGGKSRLQMNMDGLCATFVQHEVKVGSKSVRVTAGKKQVIVHGKAWKATADQVQIVPGKETAILSGHVKLLSDKVGVCSSARAERMCVSLEDGHVVS